MDHVPEKSIRRAALRYFLLQLPGQVCFLLIVVLFRRWMGLSELWAWGLFALWVGKDIVLFLFLWRYYDTDPHADPSRMAGRAGVSLTRLDPEGHVLVRGERWQAYVAEESPPIEKGEEIRVLRVHGLRLAVRRENARQG